MKALFVTSTYPDDIHMANSGIHQRMKLFMEAISNFASLDVLFYVGPGVEITNDCAVGVERDLEKYWGCKAKVFLCHRASDPSLTIPKWIPFSNKLKNCWPVHPYFNGGKSHKQVVAFDACIKRNPDFVFVHRLNSISPVISSKNLVKPVFFDMDDIEHKAFIRNQKQPPFFATKFLQYLKFPSLLWLERRAISLAKKTFVCSETDRDHLVKTIHLPGVVVLPNAIQIPPAFSSPENPTFLFLGTYMYPPNVIAAEFLIKKIWPIVKTELPGARLIIAGKSPENIKCFKEKNDGVEFRGFVDDLNVLYRETRVVCCPILSGSGTRIKIIEAAAYGKAIVSTTLGAEGLDFADGSEIFLRDNSESFAQACVRLSRDVVLNKTVGIAARQKAINLYGRNNAINRIASEIKACI